MLIDGLLISRHLAMLVIDLPISLNCSWNQHPSFLCWWCVSNTDLHPTAENDW